jgi:mono/diheme cytochrome c family protein
MHPHSNNSFRRAATAALFALAAGLLAFTWVVAFAPGARAQDLPAGPMEPSPPYDPASVTVPAEPPMARLGLSVYQESCAPCHGAEGRGDGPTAPDLSAPPTAFADPEAVWSRSPAELFHTTKFGRMQGMMPPWRNRLDDTQIWNAVAYAWSLHTDRLRVEAGKDLYATSCAGCHGEGGQGDGAEATGEVNDFTDLQTVIFRSQQNWLDGWQSAHPEVGTEWTLDDQTKTLEYIRSFSQLAPWESPYQPGAGVITGTVVQGTPGGTAVAGLPVALEAYLGFEQVAAYTSTVGDDGTFAFSGLSTVPDVAYLASVVADGISYSSDFLTLSTITRTVETTLPIYATTDDPSGLRINRSHWIVDQQPGALVVGEIYTFGNDGDRTFIGQLVEGVEIPVTVGIHVPEGTVEVALENGELGDRYRRVGDVIYDTMPVVPGDGTRQIIVRYALPYEGTSLDFEQEFLYPVDQLSLLVSEVPNLQVEVPAMESEGVQEMQGQAFQLWRKSAFDPQAIAISMQGLLEPGSVDPRAGAVDGGALGAAATPAISPPPDAWVGWVIGALVGAGLLAAAGVAIQRGTVRTGYSRTDLNDLRSSLLDRIARVDDLHAMGELNQAEWMRQRANLKVQLVDVVQQLEQGSPATRGG